MLNLLQGGRIFVYSRPTDMRKSMDGLENIVRHELGENPLSGDLFLFRNRTGNRLKVLHWDRNGYVVWYKRLERGTFSFPPPCDGGIVVHPDVLLQLIGGLRLDRVWKNRQKVSPGG